MLNMPLSMLLSMIFISGGAATFSHSATQKRREFEETISKINGTNTTLYFDYGDLLMRYYPSEKELAIAQFVAVLKVNPKHKPALFNLGAVLILLEKYDAAKDVFKKYIDLNPKNHRAFYNLALCLLELGQYEKAALNLRKAIKINPLNYRAFYVLGTCLMTLQYPNTALDAFQNCLRINPEYTKAKNAFQTVSIQLQRDNWNQIKTPSSE